MPVDAHGRGGISVPRDEDRRRRGAGSGARLLRAGDRGARQHGEDEAGTSVHDATSERRDSHDACGWWERGGEAQIVDAPPLTAGRQRSYSDVSQHGAGIRRSVSVARTGRRRSAPLLLSGVRYTSCSIGSPDDRRSPRPGTAMPTRLDLTRRLRFVALPLMLVACSSGKEASSDSAAAGGRGRRLRRRYHDAACPVGRRLATTSWSAHSTPTPGCRRSLSMPTTMTDASFSRAASSLPRSKDLAGQIAAREAAGVTVDNRIRVDAAAAAPERGPSTSTTSRTRWRMRSRRTARCAHWTSTWTRRMDSSSSRERHDGSACGGGSAREALRGHGDRRQPHSASSSRLMHRG